MAPDLGVSGAGLRLLRLRQRGGRAAVGYLIDVWDTEDGLPNSTVTAVAQTPDGYLWVGTYDGLARFDGVRFVTFDPGNTPELRHARVQALYVDTSGTLWIDTYPGVDDLLPGRGFSRGGDGAKRL